MEEKKFTGKRLARWRTLADLSEKVQQTLQRIEDFGCEIMTITADQVTPSFAYSVGMFDVISAPEIITVGLRAETAHHALNEVFRRMQAGVVLSGGRHRDIVGEVEVEFRPVDPKWLHQIMLRTDWFYNGEEVPVLQLIYPDLQNRFPEDPDFDQTFAQPDLSGVNSEHETVAHDLWLAYDRSSSLSSWKFEDSPHVGAYLSETVHDGTEPVTYVSHDANGDWQFLGDTMSEGGGPVLSCLHHPIDKDRSLQELHDLPLGWYAVRENTESPWKRSELPPEDNESDAGSAPEKVVN